MSGYVRKKYDSLGKVSVKGSDNVQSDFEKCPECSELTHKKRFKRNMNVCRVCNYHLKLSSMDRIKTLVDKDSFKELFTDIKDRDPLNFSGDKINYKEKLEVAKKKTKLNEAVVCGEGTLGGYKISLSIMDFSFMGGSMSSAVGEKIYRSIIHSSEEKIPLIIVSASGGARMHEGILSLMQMAKTSMALNLLRDHSIPFISIMTDPTTGGVSASFAALGDINITEPNTLIGFSGPRVIEQIMGKKLPDGFQKSNFLKDHGLIDMIIHRHDLRKKLIDIINFFYH